MRMLFTLGLLLFATACHRDPPEVQRFLGEWGPTSPQLTYSFEFKSGGRYFLHTDTGSIEGTWTLLEASDAQTVVATHVGDKDDRIQLRFQDADSVIWTSLNTNEGAVYRRR